jgi:hypothetical protein
MTGTPTLPREIQITPTGDGTRLELPARPVTPALRRLAGASWHPGILAARDPAELRWVATILRAAVKRPAV